MMRGCGGRYELAATFYMQPVINNFLSFVGPPTLFQYRLLQTMCVLGCIPIITIFCLYTFDFLKEKKWI